MTAQSVPQREIGYAAEAGPTSYNWWMYDGETTPELRWPQSVQVYDQMRSQDAQIKSVLAAVTFPVRRTPWRVDPNGARDEVVQFVADDLGLPIVGESKKTQPVRMKDRFSWSEHVRLALLMLPFGHMFFEQVYRVDEDGSRAHLRKLGERMPRTIEEIMVARDGGLVSITQCGTTLDGGYGAQQPIPVNRLVAYVLEKEGGNWLGRSILRAAYKNWLLKDRLLRVQAQTIERNGMGIPKYTAAQGETDLSKGKALATSLRAGETAGAAIPAGAELELMGVTGELPDAEPAIRYHDEQIARAVLAHFLNLGQQTGSWALGTTFADFFTLSLQTLADQIADTATQHIVEDLVDVNWGEDEPAPRIVHDEIGSRQQATAQAIKTLVDAGIIKPDDVLEESSRQQYGLPPKDPETTRDAGAGGGGGDPFGGFGDVPFGEGSVAVAAAASAEADDLDDLGDDEDLLDDDEDADALVVALEELAAEDDLSSLVHAKLSGGALANFNALHPRGHHGKFRTTVDKLKFALGQWLQAGNDPLKPSTWKSDPFRGFSREQLRRVARQRGMALKRGADRDDIVKLLAADLSQPSGQKRSAPGAPSPAAPKAPSSPTTPSWPTTISGQVVNDLQAWVNGSTPAVDPLQHYSATQLGIAARHLGLPSSGSKGALSQALQTHAVHTLKVGAPVAEQPIAPSRVGGVTGVTVRPIPPKVGLFGQHRQSQEVYLNGTKIGEIDAFGTVTWGASSPAGNPIGLGGRTRIAAIASLVQRQQLMSQPTPTAPGVSLTRIPKVFGNAPDAFTVHFNRIDIGTIHGDLSDPTATWGAFEPPNSPWTLTNRGPHATTDDAIDELVASYNAYGAANSLTGGGGTSAGGSTGTAAGFPDGISIDPYTPSSTSGYSYSAHAYFGGQYIGGVHEDHVGDWSVFLSGGAISGPLTRQKFPTRDAALHALHADYVAGPWQPHGWPGMGNVPPVAQRIQDAIDRHTAEGGGPNDPNNPLSGFTRPQLIAFAKANNVPYVKVPDRQLAAALITKMAPPPPAVAGAPAIGTITTHMVTGSPNVHLVLAGQADIGRVEKTPAGWYSYPPSGATWKVTRGNPSATMPDAVDALTDSYRAHLVAIAAAPTRPTGPRVDPAVKAAQDILYGVDPKAKTATHQLQVYGTLRTAQFNSLDPLEQSTLLADLSYIATTSKGPNATKAQKIIDRFAPPGTTPGTLPKQTSLPPPVAFAAQTHVSDPTGTPGLLKMKPAGQRGQSGDGWTRTASGGSGPWGQYGAAGLMLRHVDPSTGEERFLMVERGPGISDPGKWQFPGGAKEEKEDFYEGAAREVIEELGLKQADLDAARVHGTHSSEVSSVMVPGPNGSRVPWAYVSIAATVPTQLKPDLSSHHARMETSDAKWMTRSEIEDLDRKGKLLKPLAGGQLQQNVMTLFPLPAAPAVARPGPTTTRPPRLTGTPSRPKLPTHKTSRATSLIADKSSIDALRQEVKKGRKAYAGKAADDRLAVIGAKQGFDETPTVVSKDDFDALLATGDYVEIWRGVRGAGASRIAGPARAGGQVTQSKTAAQVNEDLRSGVAYYGVGMFGNGYYFAADKSIARQYSDSTKGSMIRALLPKKAKVEPHKKMRSGASAVGSPYSAAKNSYEDSTLYDEGRYAAALGVDAIEVTHGTPSAGHVTAPGRHTYVILNRSILIVQEA